VPLFLAETLPEGGVREVHVSGERELAKREEVPMSIRRGELDAQRRRAAKNESLFREVNERIEDLATSTFTSFVCECMSAGCDELVALTIEEYEWVRAEPSWFFVLPGHEVPEVELVVESTDRYTVVKKLGEGELLAERLDPRSRRTVGPDRAGDP
jgi:hypothetical protein